MFKSMNNKHRWNLNPDPLSTVTTWLSDTSSSYTETNIITEMAEEGMFRGVVHFSVAGIFTTDLELYLSKEESRNSISQTMCS